MLNPLHEQISSTPGSLNILESTQKLGVFPFPIFCCTGCLFSFNKERDSADILISFGMWCFISICYTGFKCKQIFLIDFLSLLNHTYVNAAGLYPKPFFKTHTNVLYPSQLSYYCLSLLTVITLFCFLWSFLSVWSLFTFLLIGLCKNQFSPVHL